MSIKKAFLKNSDKNSDNNRVRETLINLLNQQKVGVLATLSCDKPYTSIVGFAISEDLKAIYFGTPLATLKYKNILENSNTCLLIDNRQNLGTDFSEAAAVTCIGKASIASNNDCLGKELLIKKHPELKTFFSSPTCRIVKISISKYSLVKRFQEVTEFEFEDNQ